MARLHLALLGLFQVTLDARLLTGFESNKARALLAYLAAEATTAATTAAAESHPREQVAELFWPDQPPGVALANLRHLLAHLRRLLEDAGADPPALLVTRHSLQFNPASDSEVDLACFYALTAGFPNAPPTVDACRAAIGLVRGPLLQGFSLDGSPDFEEWLVVQREHVDRRAAQALALLAGAAVQQEDYAQAVAWTRRLVGLTPWNEAAHCQLIALLALAAGREAALHQAALCERLLHEDMGMSLQPETQALVERIRSGPVDATILAGLPSQTLLRPELPAPAIPKTLAFPTPFIGRGPELAQVAAMLADPTCRLVTLFGPGGIGKTRLALQAVQTQTLRFAAGVIVIDLAAVAPGDLVNALLRGLAVPETGPRDPRRRLLDYVAPREQLLLLDNCEHLVDEAGLLADLLQAAPRLKLLTTSRARLNLREEWLLPLEGLALPPEDGAADGARLDAYDATRLFVACVRRLQPGFRPNAEDARQITHVCRLLAGMPLGIELAAAWAHALPLAEIARRLAQGLDLLHTDLRDMPARHRSMVAVFDHSWQMLSARERSILRQLSVFRGGCAYDAAQAVTGADLADLAALVDKSWVRVAPSGRYEMHELTRQYCEQRLESEHAAQSGEPADRVRRRHAAYYGRYLTAPIHKMNYDRAALDEVMVEFGNVQTGLHWAARDHDVTAIRWMAITLYFVAEMIGWFHEVDRLYQSVVDLVAPEIEERSDPQRWQEAVLLQGWVLCHQSNLCLYVAQPSRGLMLIDRNQALLAQVAPSDDQRYLDIMCDAVRATCVLRGGDYVEGRRLFEAVLARYQDPAMPWKVYERPMEPRHLQAETYSFLGHAAFHLGEYDEAERLLRHSRALRAELGERRDYAHQGNWLVRLLQVKGDYAAAEELALECYRGTRLQQDQISMANALLTLGRLERELGRYAPARGHLERGLDMARSWGFVNTMLEALAELGRLELALGNPAAAMQRCEDAILAFEQLGAEHNNNFPSVVVVMGWAGLAGQNPGLAERYFRQVLTLHGRLALDSLEALVGLGAVRQQQGKPAEAAPLLAYAAQHPATAYVTRVRAQTLLGKLGISPATEHVAAAAAAAVLGEPFALVAVEPEPSKALQSFT